MTDKQEIIQLYRVNEYSIRKIARTKGISRNTVKKIIHEYLGVLSSPDSSNRLDEYLAEKPKYNCSRRRARVMTPTVCEEIDRLLKINATRLASGMKKQTMNCIDMLDILRSNGHELSYASLTRYVKNKRDGKLEPSHEAFIRQSYEPGLECEFDWGEVKLYLGGELTKFYLAVFTMCHSNHRMAYLFRHQDTLAFMESHRNYFRDMSGVPYVMVYDNMRTAVASFVGTEKLPTESLMKMSTYYRYRYRFCNARRGNEKGHVERSVEYVRRKAFSYDVRFKSIDEASLHLRQTCDRLNRSVGSISTECKAEAVMEDLSALQAWPGDIGCFSMEEYHVDKWSTVSIKKCHYSVPDSLVGRKVAVRIYSEKLEMLSEGNVVASHQRFYTNGRWSVKLEHYLNTFGRKPGALPGSEALKQAPESLARLFRAQFQSCPKDFVLMLTYAKENGFTYDDIIRSYETLRAKGLTKVSGDQIKSMLGSSPDGEIRMPERPKDSQEQSIVTASDRQLDSLTSVMTAKVKDFSTAEQIQTPNNIQWKRQNQQTKES